MARPSVADPALGIARARDRLDPLKLADRLLAVAVTKRARISQSAIGLLHLAHGTQTRPLVEPTRLFTGDRFDRFGPPRRTVPLPTQTLTRNGARFLAGDRRTDKLRPDTAVRDTGVVPTTGRRRVAGIAQTRRRGGIGLWGRRDHLWSGMQDTRLLGRLYLHILQSRFCRRRFLRMIAGYNHENEPDGFLPGHNAV